MSADPPEVNREFRQKLGLTLPLISDEKHETADYYGLPISYQSPRARVYPNGFFQPAVFAYQKEREIFRFIHRSSFFDPHGALWRPSANKVLKAMRRAAG